jgi:inhibitor of cysteine peptidase
MNSRKIKQSLSIIVAMLIISTLTACGSNVPEALPTPTDTDPVPVYDPLPVSKSENGKQIEITKGELIRIQLPATPGAGYAWELTEIDEQILKQEGESQFQTADPNIVGGSEYQTFLLKAENTGRTNLELVYRRPWEKDVDPLETFTLTVIISEK